MYLSDSNYLFIHIPKTGGTSFRVALERVISSKNIFYDYGALSDNTSSIIKDIVYNQQDQAKFFRYINQYSGPKYLLGHNVSKYYSFFYPQNIYTLVRDPVQQVISHYKHYTRHHGYKKDLLDFIQDSNFQNMQKKTLGPIIPSTIGFLGINEDYSEFIRKISLSYGIKFSNHFVNNNPDKHEEKYSVDSTIENIITELNSEDVGLYRLASLLYSDYQELERSDSEFTYGIYEVHSTHVNGWAYSILTQEPIDLVILINNIVYKEVTANQFRAGLKERNAPRNGCVGFYLKLPENIDIRKDQVQCMVKTSNQLLRAK